MVEMCLPIRLVMLRYGVLDFANCIQFIEHVKQSAVAFGMGSTNSEYAYVDTDSLWLLVENGWRYEIVGDCGLLSCPVTPNLMSGRMFG